MIKGPVRVGIVGGGRWGQFHGQVLRGAGAELAGFLVETEESCIRLRDGFGYTATRQAARFFETPMDAVVIASPNFLHAEHAIRALRSGRHVLVEKPMALTLEDCDKILEAASQAHRVLAVGLQMRGFFLFSHVKRVITEGALGKPVHLRLDLSRKPHRTGSGGWRQDIARCGPPALEEPIHYLDLMRWYFAPWSSPLRVHAKATSRPGREALQEILDISVELSNQARAVVTRNLCGEGHHATLEITLEHGMVRARWDGNADTDATPTVRLEVIDGSGVRPIPTTSRTGHAHDGPYQAEAFVQAIRGNGKPLASGEDGRASVALSLAAHQSVVEGTTVSLSPNTRF